MKNKKTLSHNITLKKHSERNSYNRLLKTTGLLSEERTFQEEDSEGTNSGNLDVAKNEVNNVPVIKKSRWFVIKDAIKENIIALGAILGFVGLIAGTTIWFNNLRRDVDSVQSDITGLKSKYDSLDSTQIADSNEFKLFKQELKMQIDSLSSRANQVESRLKIFR